MLKFITENRRGLKAEGEGLPNSCKAGCFTRADGKYLCCVIAQYSDPFFSHSNPVPEAVVSLFEDLIIEEGLNEIFSDEDNLGGGLFIDFLYATNKIGSELAPLDADFDQNLSFIGAVVNTETLKTLIGCHGDNAHAIITDKATQNITYVWPKKLHGSLNCYGFMLEECNNILLCNYGFWQNIYNVRDGLFYTGYDKTLCSPLKDIFYTRSLHDIGYIAIDLATSK